jgi:hypothetical protein
MLEMPNTGEERYQFPVKVRVFLQGRVQRFGEEV